MTEPTLPPAPEPTPGSTPESTSPHPSVWPATQPVPTVPVQSALPVTGAAPVEGAPVEGAAVEGAAVEGAPVEAAAPSKPRRPVLIAGAAAAVLLVGGGAYAAKSGLDWFTGSGGARPEQAVPANSMAFGSVDLDPSGSQKLDALRFIMKFPQSKDALGEVNEKSDPRKSIFESLQKNGSFSDVNYAQDVEPWLGTRFGAAVVPKGDSATYLLVIPHKDAAQAKTGLAKLTKGAADMACEVGEEFALCSQKGTDVAGLVSAAKSGSLADSANYKADSASVPSDNLATLWYDAGAVAKIDLSKLAESTGGLGSTLGSGAPTAMGDMMQGRLFMGARFDGPNFELVGHASGAAQKFVDVSGSIGIGNLPADTVGAISMLGAKDQFLASWPQFEKQFGAFGGGDMATILTQIEEQTGIKVPADVAAAVGNDLTIAFGGMAEGGTPKVAVRSDGDKAVQAKFFGLADGSGLTFVSREASGKQVWALSDDYAAAVASGSGLGDSAVFKNALPDVGSARLAVFLDLAGLTKAMGSDVPADTKKVLDAFGGIGFTMSGKGDSADFRFRLTTK